jgi:hypothetical protein
MTDMIIDFCLCILKYFILIKEQLAEAVQVTISATANQMRFGTSRSVGSILATLPWSQPMLATLPLSQPNVRWQSKQKHENLIRR